MIFGGPSVIIITMESTKSMTIFFILSSEVGSKLPNTKVLQTYLQDLRSDRPQPTPARSLKPQESKVEQPALANASRSPDVRTAIDLESDESPSPKAATLRYSPSTPAESAPGSVAKKGTTRHLHGCWHLWWLSRHRGWDPWIWQHPCPEVEKHEHHLSENAVRCRARRVFTPRVDGSKKVSETVFKEWHSKGQPRKNLEQIFKQCGYDPESFIWIWFLFLCISFCGYI